MGRKKTKFIDKKKSATFQLLARDTSADHSADAASGSADRVFVRVDNNPYIVRGLGDEESDHGGGTEDEDPRSIFADAPGDSDEDGQTCPPPWIGGSKSRTVGPLPDDVRKEILELGFPDDGYNYLLHLREIKNAGGGSAYYHNSKAQLDRVPLDVKAYDASRLRISSEVDGESNRDSVYNVASKTIGVRVQKAVDPDVERLLDDSDLSRFGSDVEDMEEDFVVKANLPDGQEEELRDESIEENKAVGSARDFSLGDNENDFEEDDELEVDQKPRARRLLDEQFDLLTLREYESDSESADGDSESDDAGEIDAEGESLAAKLNDALKVYAMDDLKLEHKYKVPGDFVHGQQASSTGTQLDASTSDVIRKYVEYAEKYCYENQDDEEMVVIQESSDESEVWDCESIVSTYSNLDNHPGIIQAPQNSKKRVPRYLPGDSIMKGNVIALKGKEKLPVDYLPHNKRTVGKVKAAVSSGVDKLTRRPNSEESKEEKKARKAAVKEERREARRAKKDLKGLYRCEAQRAQKVAAVSGPSSIHLM